MDGLLSVNEALRRLLGQFAPVETIRVSLKEAAGRVLAEEILAGTDLPSFANSSMDGFAVLAADVSQASREQPVTLSVVEDVRAGQVAHTSLSYGQAARIMTGAPLPAGAEAVIPVEDTDFNERQPGVAAPPQVRIFRPAHAGENVRPRGQDVRAGETVLHLGSCLRPQDVGLLAMLGVAQAPVYRRPRVAVLSTGDELLPVETPLQPGKIHDSNAYTLTALIVQHGGEPLDLGISPDDEAAIRECLDRAVAERVDLVLSSAGVSVGAFDFVRRVVETHGQLSFWRVSMRPGKPLAFGNYQGIPIIGLPGNPVSAFVGFEVFVRPALAKLAGLADWRRPTQKVTLAEAVESDGRESYLRAVVSSQGGRLLARLTGHQGSGNLLSLVQANALLIVPNEVKSLPPGAEVDAWLFGGVFQTHS